MFDGLWLGMIGGLFGPALMQFLRRFRYISIFSLTVVLTILAFFMIDVCESGWNVAIQRIVSKKFFIYPLTGMGSGALTTFCVWFCALINSASRNDDPQKTGVVAGKATQADVNESQKNDNNR